MQIASLFLFLSLHLLASADKTLDYCSYSKSRVVTKVIRDFKQHYGDRDLYNDNCPLLNLTDLSINPYMQFESVNKSSSTVFRCPVCPKEFSDKQMALNHYKLFHLNDNPKCLANFYSFLNGDRYKSFFKKNEINKTPCDKTLIPFMQHFCMNLVNGCFKKKADYLDFFSKVCGKIDCESKIIKHHDAESLSVFHSIIVYITFVISSIYLIIVWIGAK